MRGPEEGTTEASEFAQAWFSTLLQHMGIEGEVKGTGSDTRIHLFVRAERAGRIIGKRGNTLAAIRHLLGLALAENGDLTLDVDVDDPRPAEGRSERPPRQPRESSSSSRYPEEKLTALAKRAAEKALETGKPITINLELNAYDRRVIHLAVAEVEGVSSQSADTEGPHKTIQVVPELTTE